MCSLSSSRCGGCGRSPHDLRRDGLPTFHLPCGPEPLARRAVLRLVRPENLRQANVHGAAARLSSPHDSGSTFDRIGASGRDERCPCGPGLSCFAPSPGGAGPRPLQASIPIAGAPPASRRFAGRPERRDHTSERLASERHPRLGLRSCGVAPEGTPSTRTTTRGTRSTTPTHFDGHWRRPSGDGCSIGRGCAATPATAYTARFGTTREAGLPSSPTWTGASARA